MSQDKQRYGVQLLVEPDHQVLGKRLKATAKPVYEALKSKHGQLLWRVYSQQSSSSKNENFISRGALSQAVKVRGARMRCKWMNCPSRLSQYAGHFSPKLCFFNGWRMTGFLVLWIHVHVCLMRGGGGEWVWTLIMREVPSILRTHCSCISGFVFLFFCCDVIRAH